MESDASTPPRPDVGGAGIMLLVRSSGGRLTKIDRLFSQRPSPTLLPKMIRLPVFTARKTPSFRAGLAAIAAILTVGVTPAVAVPVFDDFGSQPGFEFGGSGIPNDGVASSTYADANGSVLFGMTATQRFDNPVVTNDGAGTYYAQPGADTAHGQPTYALWNFDFDSDIISGDLTGYSFTLSYGSQSLAGIPLGYGDSWNLGMAFLGVPAFDPSVDNVYNFALDLISPTGASVDTVGIDVVVGNGNTVPDGGSTAVLMGVGLIGLAVLGRRWTTPGRVSRVAV
jgi:hypothetical protein